MLVAASTFIISTVRLGPDSCREQSGLDLSGSEKPLEKLARAAADLSQLDVQRLIVQMVRRPAADQFFESLELVTGSGQPAAGLP